MEVTIRKTLYYGCWKVEFCFTWMDKAVVYWSVMTLVQYFLLCGTHPLVRQSNFEIDSSTTVALMQRKSRSVVGCLCSHIIARLGRNGIFGLYSLIAICESTSNVAFRLNPSDIAGSSDITGSPKATAG